MKRGLVTKLPGSAFVLLSVILQSQKLWLSAVKMCCHFMVVRKSLSKAYLALFLSYFKTIFKMTKPVCEGFTDSHQFLEVFQQLCCNQYTWLYRGLLLLFIHQFPFHVIVISIVKVNVQLIGAGHGLEKHFHDNRSPRDCL